jgi:uncharacterized protein (DUF924 family)
MSRVDDILTFWFGTPQDNQAYYDTWHKRWFTSDPQFDLTIREEFLADYQLSADRKLMQWQDTPRSSLALIVLLDQFPRNMFRGEPRAFATDSLAREVAAHLLHLGFDRQLLPVERSFVYLPFMHSEIRSDQQQSVSLFRQLAQERPYLNSVSYALRHQEIIERFGRFPHRNVVLGRVSTPAEVEFLQQPGSSF